jgi:hypothetical protein
MTTEEIIQTKEFQSVVNDYRAMCLWFFPVDFMPSSTYELNRVLESIERYGDMAAYKRIGRIRKWLSQTFNADSSDFSPFRA